MTARSIVLLGLLGLLAWGCENKSAPKPVEDSAKTEKVKLGKGLAGAEEVAVRDLLADPEKYQDKLVRVSGKVLDFCHHRRAWFGVSAKDGQGMLRVFTLPRFETPADCLGKQVTAEGKVELIEIAAEDVAHYAKEHKFLAGLKVEEGKPLKRPIIRAFGAELW